MDAKRVSHRKACSHPAHKVCTQSVGQMWVVKVLLESCWSCSNAAPVVWVQVNQLWLPEPTTVHALQALHNKLCTCQCNSCAFGCGSARPTGGLEEEHDSKQMRGCKDQRQQLAQFVVSCICYFCYQAHFQLSIDQLTSMLMKYLDSALCEIKNIMGTLVAGLPTQHGLPLH